MWNYKTQRPYLAYEDVHQGDKYFRRKFKFNGNKVVVDKLSIVYKKKPAFPTARNLFRKKTPIQGMLRATRTYWARFT